MSGYFTEYKKEAAPALIRIRTNGAQDPSFSVGDGLDGPATAIVPLRDGGAFIGGHFNRTTVSGSAISFGSVAMAHWIPTINQLGLMMIYRP